MRRPVATRGGRCAFCLLTTVFCFVFARGFCALFFSYLFCLFTCSSWSWTLVHNIGCVFTHSLHVMLFPTIVSTAFFNQ